jgi:hypothetical protein
MDLTVFFGRVLGFPELGVKHYLFEVLVVEVCRGPKNRTCARLRLGLGKKKVVIGTYFANHSKSEMDGL